MTEDSIKEEQFLKQWEDISRGVAEIVPEEELKNKIKKSIEKRSPLRVKLGVDPSSPDLHVGHTVVLEKLRHFQKHGHQVIFVIGDFTAQIGDPTGRSETRKNLSKEEVLQNAHTYSSQVLKILNPNKTQVVFNSQWNDKLKIQEVIRLASQMTVARMLERDDFSKRYKAQQSICLHEFMYPILQAYDSVQLRSDVELGGTDQKFNVLLGREYQRAAGQEPQCVLLTPILEGTDGVQKMSKSLNNYIGITESAKDIFGKIMSISDDLMHRYYEVLTDVDLANVKAEHPREAKVKLAQLLVERYYDTRAADKARSEFESMFSKGENPEDMPEFHLNVGNEIELIRVLTESSLLPSLSEARRLIKQNAISVNGEKVNDTNFKISKGSDEIVVKAGKRKFLRIVSK